MPPREEFIDTPAEITQMMRRWFAPALLACLFGSLMLLSAAEDKKDGWVQLFNGKDLTGWKLPPKPGGAIKEVVEVKKDGKLVGYKGKLAGDKEVDLWRVEKGILIGSGPASHLFSERGDYKDFHYRVEAMINDKGNSGQYFHTKFEGGFPTGWEAQINATHGDPVKTGSLYPDGRQKDLRAIKEIQVRNKAPHKPNEWFTQEVICKGPKITILVNGKKTVEWTDPKHRFKSGHFALQGHDPGTVVRFRKIEVKELSTPAVAGKDPPALTETFDLLKDAGNAKLLAEVKKVKEGTAADKKAWLKKYNAPITDAEKAKFKEALKGITDAKEKKDFETAWNDKTISNAYKRYYLKLYDSE
jgi:hypothetical protein